MTLDFQKVMIKDLDEKKMKKPPLPKSRLPSEHLDTSLDLFGSAGKDLSQYQQSMDKRNSL